MVDTLTAQGTYGQHIIHEDFYGGHRLGTGGVGTEAVTTYVVDETDGVLALTTGANDGDSAVIGNGAVFSPATNGPLALEARVKVVSLTSSTAFVGFVDQDPNTDEAQDAGTIDASTLEVAALIFDTGIDADQWNEYIGTGGVETQQNLVAEQLTADAWQVLRVEIDPNGTVRTYIADTYGRSGYGVGSLRLIAERSKAISKTALLFASVYAASNTASAKTLEIDYYHLTANRDWAVA